MNHKEFVYYENKDVTINENCVITKTIKYTGIIDENGIFHLKTLSGSRMVKIITEADIASLKEVS